MKQQSNHNKAKHCQWYRNKDGLNYLLNQLNENIKRFEEKHKVKVVIKSDFDRSLYFEKVFFEEVKPNVIKEL